MINAVLFKFLIVYQLTRNHCFRFWLERAGTMHQGTKQVLVDNTNGTSAMLAHAKDGTLPGQISDLFPSGKQACSKI